MTPSSPPGGARCAATSNSARDPSWCSSQIRPRRPPPTHAPRTRPCAQASASPAAPHTSGTTQHESTSSSSPRPTSITATSQPSRYPHCHPRSGRHWRALAAPRHPAYSCSPSGSSALGGAAPVPASDRHDLTGPAGQDAVQSGGFVDGIEWLPATEIIEAWGVARAESRTSTQSDAVPCRLRNLRRRACEGVSPWVARPHTSVASLFAARFRVWRRR